MTSMLSTYRAWYESTYPRLTDHGLWLRGGEPGTLPAEEYGRRSFRVLISRLSTYLDTAESTTHRVLYQIARGAEGVFPDLAYLPPPPDAPLFAEAGVPWLLGTQTKLGPPAFDLIALSNAVVQELVNVIVVLRRSGIPLGKRERLADPSVPLVIMGGANAAGASLFFTANPPVDGIFAGESVDCIRRILAVCRDAKCGGLTKEETLARLETVPGFVQPDRPAPTRKRHDPDPGINTALVGAPVPYRADHAGRESLQISEGCACFCGFCSESWVRKPYREVPAVQVLAEAAALKAGGGLGRLDLSSFNFNMHDGFREIVDGLVGMVDTVSLKSQRFNAIAAEPDLLKLLQAVGKSSITCGLEGISPRLRRCLHKSLDETGLQRSLRVILTSPVRELKVFLLATGLETESDFTEFQGLVSSMASLLKGAASPPRVIFSVTPLVRFPWTPLEFSDAPEPGRLRPVINRMRSAVSAAKFEFREAGTLNDYWLSQVLVRAREPAVLDALAEAADRSGFVWYREVPQTFVRDFADALRDRGIKPDRLLAGHPTDEQSLPWLCWDMGVDRTFLVRQYERHLSGTDAGHCLGRAEAAGHCLACGACGTPDARAAMTAPRHRSPVTAAALAAKVRGLRSRETEIGLIVDVGDKARGVPRPLVGAVLARALMGAAPELAPFYRRYAGSHWSSSDEQPWITGQDVLRSVWLLDGIAALRARLADELFRREVDRLMQGWGTLVGPAQTPQPQAWAVAVQAPFRFDAQAFSAAAKVKYVLRREDGGWYRAELTAASKAKRSVTALRFVNNPDGTSLVELEAGSRFDPAVFARTSFALPDPGDWVRVALRAAHFTSTISGGL